MHDVAPPTAVVAAGPDVAPQPTAPTTSATRATSFDSGPGTQLTLEAPGIGRPVWPTVAPGDDR